MFILLKVVFVLFLCKLLLMQFTYKKIIILKHHKRDLNLNLQSIENLFQICIFSEKHFQNTVDNKIILLKLFELLFIYFQSILFQENSNLLIFFNPTVVTQAVNEVYLCFKKYLQLQARHIIKSFAIFPYLHCILHKMSQHF